MVKIVAKYRHLLSFGCLLFYLSCTFQPSILESLHFLSHLGKMVQHKYVDHGMDHDESHEHDFLNLLEISFNTSADHPSGKDENRSVNLKKIPELGFEAIPVPELDMKIVYAFPDISEFYLSPDFNILLPPPRG